MPKLKTIFGIILVGLAILAGVVVHWVWLIIFGIMALLVFVSSSEASSFRITRARAESDGTSSSKREPVSPTGVKRYLRKDLVWSIAFIVVWIIVGAGSVNPLSIISGPLLFLIAILAIWRNEWTRRKTGMTRTIVPIFIGFVRWMHLVGMLYRPGILIFNAEILSTIVGSKLLGAGLILSYVRLVLTYKVLADWSLSLQKTNRVDLKKDRRLIVIIIALVLLGELLAWGWYGR